MPLHRLLPCSLPLSLSLSPTLSLSLSPSLSLSLSPCHVLSILPNVPSLPVSLSICLSHSPLLPSLPLSIPLPPGLSVSEVDPEGPLSHPDIFFTSPVQQGDKLTGVARAGGVTQYLAGGGGGVGGEGDRKGEGEGGSSGGTAGTGGVQSPEEWKQLLEVEGDEQETVRLQLERPLTHVSDAYIYLSI